MSEEGGGPSGLIRYVFPEDGVDTASDLGDKIESFATTVAVMGAVPNNMFSGLNGIGTIRMTGTKKGGNVSCFVLHFSSVKALVSAKGPSSENLPHAQLLGGERERGPGTREWRGKVYFWRKGF